MASGGHIRANFAGPFQYSPDAGAPASKDKQMENMCVAKISKDLNGMMEKQNNEGDRQKNARDSLVGEGSEDEGDNASDVESNAAKRSQSPVSMFESDSN
jgi:hypothetical protein